MSTRGCVARLTSKPGSPISFSGKYLHLDNYPGGTGATLFKLWRTHFKKDTNALLKVLIDDCKSGWSTINNCDFNLPPAPREDFSNVKCTIKCTICGLPNWRHYKQYYEESNKRWVEAGRPTCPVSKDNSYLVADHSPKDEQKPHGPECYAEDEVNETNEKNASDCGVEYVYAFTPDGKTMVVLSSYCESGSKMIGMFGCGDPNAEWKVIGEIELAGRKPKWDKIPITQPPRKPKKQKPKSVKEITAKKAEKKIVGEAEAENIMG